MMAKYIGRAIPGPLVPEAMPRSSWNLWCI